MSQEDFSVEFVLESIEAVMSEKQPLKQPKVLLFDIGGVCVVSPMQAILDYETEHSVPTGWVNFSISRSAPNGFWQKLERGEIQMDASYFAGFSKDLHNPSLWETFYTTKALPANPSLPKDLPPLPKVDAEFLFWSMMSHSRAFDPWMYPALLTLKASKKYILAALSNTVIFPPTHPYSHPHPSEDIRLLFDLFISSAHIGLRKPTPEIYAYALDALNKLSLSNSDTGIKPEDILFLDDIGENLKAAKKAGFRTIKVSLGRAYEAVDELERITGLKLAGGHPTVPVVAKINGKAKL